MWALNDSNGKFRIYTYLSRAKDLSKQATMIVVGLIYIIIARRRRKQKQSGYQGIAEKIIITLLKLESMLFLRIWVEYPPAPLSDVAATSGIISATPLRPWLWCSDTDALAVDALRLLVVDRATRLSLFVVDKIDAWIALISIIQSHPRFIYYYHGLLSVKGFQEIRSSVGSMLVNWRAWV